MERVVEIKGRYSYSIYPFELVAQESVIQNNHEGLEVLTFYRKGALSVLDHQEIAHSKDIVMATVFDARLNGKG